jgi:hypothetical protein
MCVLPDREQGPDKVRHEGCIEENLGESKMECEIFTRVE